MIKRINAVELQQRMAKQKNLKLIDVRETQEYEKAHIDGTVSLPVSSFKQNYQDVLQDKDEEIILICRSGGRSMAMALYLEKQGFSNLTNFEGGVLSWREENYKVEPTDEIMPGQLKSMPELI
jgi:rhodanese-related sulfurtransferase